METEKEICPLSMSRPKDTPFYPLPLPETAVCMVGRRLSGLCRCGVGKSDE